MTVNSVNQSSLNVDRMLSLRTQLDGLQRQLGTGMKADNYADLGAGRSTSLNVRAQRAELDGFMESISRTGVTMSIMTQTLERLDQLSVETKGDAIPTSFVLQNGNKTTAQVAAGFRFTEAVSLLNTEVDGRYVFSGLSNDTRPVAPADAILNGVAGQSGFKQVMAERAQADLGGSLADPVLTGRLDFTSAGTVTSVAENGGGVFGLRLDATAGASTSSSNIQITGPSGAPNRLDIDVLGGVNLGETLRLTYTLPDGTSRDVVLTSASERSAGQSAFVIDADPAVTAANIQTALREVTDGIARRELPAASASRAGRDFFDEVPPLRVVPDATNGIAGATALVADAAGTVTWYRGEDGPLDARSTSSTRVDDAVRLAYGARANEDAMRTTLRELAVFSAQTFDVSDPAAADRYAQVAQRSRSALDDPSGANLPRSIALEIGTANTLMEATKDRHISTRAIFDDILDGTDGVTEEEVAAKLLNIQTRLEASYAVTAMLRDLSLVNYLR